MEENISEKPTNDELTEQLNTETNSENNASSVSTDIENSLSKLEKELTEQKDKYLRLAAEFDNFRKRTIKERMELMQNAGKDVLTDFLPLMDDFDRALKSITEDSEMQDIILGIELIYSKYSGFLIKNGVKEIEAINTPFNVDLHDAITKVPAPEEALKGKVIDVIEKGYILNDKVLRYAKVVVGE